MSESLNDEKADMSLADVAKELDISRRTLNSYMDKKLIRYYRNKINDRVFFKKSDVISFKNSLLVEMDPKSPES